MASPVRPRRPRRSPDRAAIAAAGTGIERVSLSNYPGYRPGSSVPELIDAADHDDGKAPPRRRRVTQADRQAWQDWQQGRIEDAFAEGQRAQAEKRAVDALNAYERAHRLSPDDPVLMFALGLARSQCGDVAGCLSLMERLAAQCDMREAWVTAASCALALGLPHQAARHAEHLLATHGFAPSLSEVLDTLAVSSGRAGWCALSGAEPPTLNVVCSGPVRAVADGRTVALGEPGRRSGWRAYRLPDGWQHWTSLSVCDAHGAPLLGSPIQPARIAKIAGFVEAGGAHRITGWAWYPADPERLPEVVVRVAQDDGEGPIVARLALDRSADPLPGDALARPRRISFAVPRRWRGMALDLTDPSGQSLLGSPIDPMLLSGAAGIESHPAGPCRPKRRAGRALARAVSPRAIDVVIPVYRHCRRSLACIDSVRATMPPDARIVVVEDNSPEPPLRVALATLAREGAIVLLRTSRNRGFTHAANLGLQAGPERDVVLLNSDTLVGPGWLEHLRRVAYGPSPPGTAIGSVTPLSNDATILSYPDPRGSNPLPDARTTVRFAALAARANGDEAIDIPTAIGFCMFIRRDCLDQVGLLREDLYAQGYGEENDWSLRAARLGWRNVAATGIYVAHEGGASFGNARHFLMERNLAILERWHPGYARLVAAHIDDDPLRESRRRLDRLRLLDAPRDAAAVQAGRTVALVTHDQGGGVERVVRARVDALRGEGCCALVLRPSSEGGLCVVSDSADNDYPNLAFRLPGEYDALCSLLREAGVSAFEWHHMLGHEPQVRDLPASLGVPFDIVVHDYAAFCPRVTLVSYGRRYCGEPALAACEACVAALGRRTDEEIGVAALRARSRLEFAAARQVVVPSEDVARRIERHFPDTSIRVRPWEDDRPGEDLARFAEPASHAPVAVLPRVSDRIRVVLLGGIGPEKGYDVLLDCLACVRDEGLPLEFVIAGFTPDDARLREAGCGPITGEYREGELPGLLARFDADVAFLPSIWPETWSFTLTEAWRAGLPAVVFDLGTQAARVRHTGRGAVLPIALPPSMICRQLVMVAQRSGPKRGRVAQNGVAPQLSRVQM